MMLFFVACENEKVEDSLFNYEWDNIENHLISQINWNLDDYLAYLNPSTDRDIITLKEIKKGNYTNINSNELFITFHVDAVHSAGLDRTIAVIYNANSLELITQKTFVADTVYLHILPSESTHILFIGDVTYQGLSTYKANLFELYGNQWVEKTIDESFESTENLYYSFTNGNILHVFTLNYDEKFHPTFIYEDELIWHNNTFEKRTKIN